MWYAMQCLKAMNWQYMNAKFSFKIQILETNIILYGNYNSKTIIKGFIWTKDDIVSIAKDHD